MNVERNKKIILTGIGILFFSIFSYTALLSINIDCKYDDCKLTIDKNATLGQIAYVIEDKLNLNPIVFKISMYLTFNEAKIKYGRYNLKAVKNLRDLIYMLTSVSSERVKVTIVEGWKIQDIALELEDKMDIDIETFISLCYDNNMINLLDVDSNIFSLEGFLFPDTYIFLKSYTEKDIIRILLDEFVNNYNENISDTKLSIYDTVILASIIQGESKFRSDMDTISSVYHNRLNKNMLLQADPTIQYLLPKQKKKVLYKDIEIDSPYNTYKYKGLPPGPINSPGLDALIAASKPPSSNYLFFVADGKGAHIFNTTYNNHLKSKRNVSRKSK